MRRGIQTGQGVLREYAVNRIDKLLGFNLVPETVLRPVNDGTDVASVQLEVKPKAGETGPGFLTEETYRELVRLGPEHPMADWVMESAIEQFVVWSEDAHPKNVKHGENIDLGLSDENGPLSPMRSVFMEIIQQHPDWKASPKTVAKMEKLFSSTKEYLTLREERKAAVAKGLPSTESAAIDEEHAAQIRKEAGGKEIKHVTELLRMLYGNEKIAQKEAISIFSRIREVIKNGRPPMLEIGDAGKTLQPIADQAYLLIQMEQARKEAA
jgi:hypothetical protein